MVMSTCLLI